MQLINTGSELHPHIERGGKVHNLPSMQGASRTGRRMNSKNAQRRIAQRRTQQALRVGRRGGRS